MGGSTFQVTSFGRTVHYAFENAKMYARHYNGHQEGYSGDIQTKTRYVMIIPMGRKIDTVIEETLMDEKSEVSDKDGPAGAIILKGAAAKKYREENGLVGKHGEVVLFFGWARS